MPYKTPDVQRNPYCGAPYRKPWIAFFRYPTQIQTHKYLRRILPYK